MLSGPAQAKTLEEPLKVSLEDVADNCKAAVVVLGSYVPPAAVLALALRVGTAEQVERIDKITASFGIKRIEVPAPPADTSQGAYVCALEKVILKAGDSSVYTHVTTCVLASGGVPL